MESVGGRLWLIMSIILDNKPWKDIKSYPEKINNVTKDQIIDVANKYFNDNYLIVRSDKGDHDKVKLEKPPFKPVAPKNTEAKSEYAKQNQNMQMNWIKSNQMKLAQDL